MRIKRPSFVSSSAARHHKGRSGFTLIELLITVAILAILMAVIAPSFTEAILSNKLASYSNNFVASANLARSEAIKRNSTVRMCRSGNGASCASNGGWQQGWIVFHDANNNSDVDAGETVIQVQNALSTDYHFTGDSYSIVFRAIGAGSTSATLALCRATPSPGGQERAITVSVTGRASVNTTRTGICA